MLNVKKLLCSTLAATFAGTLLAANPANILDFNGTSQYVKVGGSATENANLNCNINGSQTDGYSAMAWIKVPADGGGYVTSFRITSASEFYLKVDPSTGVAGAGFGGGYGGVGHVTDATGTDLRDGKWHHIAFTMNSTTLTLYVDGTAVKDSVSANYDDGLKDGNAVPLTIGARNDATNSSVESYFKGQIDDLRIYNGDGSIPTIGGGSSEQITAAELRQIINTGATINDEALVGWYKLNDSDAGGQTVANSSTSSIKLGNGALNGTMALTANSDDQPHALLDSITNLQPLSATSNWGPYGLSPASYTLAYSTNADMSSPTSVTVGNGGTDTSADITGLNDSTTYYYQVSTDSGEASFISTFKTIPKDGSQALTLNGTDERVRYNNGSSAYDALKPFTWESWVKTTDSDGVIYSLYDGTAGKTQLEFRVTGGKAFLRRGNGTISTTITGTTDINDDKWHHVAGIFDGAQLLLYVDGVEDATPVADTNSLTFSAVAPSYIGDRFWPAGQRLAGTIDELRIWNTARTLTEIRQSMYSNATESSALVAYWDFETTDFTPKYSAAGITYNSAENTDATNFVPSGAGVVNLDVGNELLTATGTTAIANAGLKANANLDAGGYAYLVQNSTSTNDSVDNIAAPAQSRSDRTWYLASGKVTAGADQVTLTFTAAEIFGGSTTFDTSKTFYLLYRATLDDNFTTTSILTSSKTTTEVAFSLAAAELATGYYAIGANAALVTPAIGLTAEINGNVLSWQVDSEPGVVEYQVMVDGVLYTTITADNSGEYSVELPEIYNEVVIITIDESGYSQSFTTDSTTEIISIQPGWNLLSLPLEAGETSISKLKESILGPIWGWKGNSYTFIDTPSAQQGFWVFATKAKEIVVSGTPVSGQIELNTAWNLAGPASNCHVPAGLTVYGWGSTYEQILDQDNGMISGQGYWIYSDELQTVILK